MSEQEMARRRALLNRFWDLHDEMTDEFGGETVRKLFSQLGKRPRGRPSGTRNKEYRPDDPKAAERKRAAYHKIMDDIIASIAPAKK